MSTAAYDTRYLSVDRQITGEYKMEQCKLFHLADGSVAAASGNVEDCQRFLRWYADGHDIDAWPSKIASLGVLLASPDGTVKSYEEGPVILDVTGQITAIGSGASFALGAMHAGKTAEAAVEIASKLDTHTGFGVDTIDTTKLKVRKRRR